MLIAKVAVEKLSAAADREFDYAVLPEDVSKAKVGVRVVVPFGRGNHGRSGIILSLEESDAERKLKAVSEYSDAEPLLTSELTELSQYVSDRCFCSRYEVIKTMLPVATRVKCEEFIRPVAGVNVKPELRECYNRLCVYGCASYDEFRKSYGSLTVDLIDCGAARIEYVCGPKGNDSFVKGVSLAVSSEEAEEYIASLGASVRSKHERVLDILTGIDNIPFNELCYLAGVTRSVIETLEKRGIVEITDIELYRNPYKNKESSEKPNITLSDEQSAVFEGLKELFDDDKAHCALLHGVTGSGKTLIYIKLIEYAISKNKNAILLVPEISLTPQLTDIMTSYFGSVVAVMHSGMSVGERYDQWKRVKRGLAKIVLGTRSAIFAPFDSTSLIILDEEHEGTYKSDMTPRYHARDVAKFRAAYNKGLLLLASATPSIESYSAAKSGRYKLFELTSRFGEAKLPEVIISDMVGSLKKGSSSIFGDKLLNAIRDRLSRNEQVILFHNRRGYNTFIGCGDCGHVFTCPNCSISMTYHSANKLLMCHYCGHTEEIPTKCSACGGNNIRFLGVGTQKVVEEIQRLLPDAKTVRMDLDTTNYKMAHEKILGDFATGKYDILIGTQMVTKGLDMENVTLVGILNADMMLFSEDYKCSETAFSTLTQVIGRAGRADKPGEAVIQTFNPENTIIKLAAVQDYKNFYDTEISFRKMMIYPPYCDLCQFIVSGSSQEKTAKGAQTLCEYLKNEFVTNNIKNVILYPSLPSALFKVSNKFRYRILLKCRNSAELRALIKAAVSKTLQENSGISVIADMNPQL